jgi:hypothetical protein
VPSKPQISWPAKPLFKSQIQPNHFKGGQPPLFRRLNKPTTYIKEASKTSVQDLAKVPCMQEDTKTFLGSHSKFFTGQLSLFSRKGNRF